MMHDRVYNPELTNDPMADCCVKVDEYEYEWVLQCLTEIKAARPDLLADNDLCSLVGNILENS